MLKRLIPIVSEESYHAEDNCSGTLYIIPIHCLLNGSEKCWKSGTIVRENTFDSELNLNSVENQYVCSCGQVFKVFIKDRFCQ